MTVKELIVELLNYPMDSKIDVLVNFGNAFLAKFDIDAGEEISDWYEISEIKTTDFSNGRKDISICVEQY